MVRLFHMIKYSMLTWRLGCLLRIVQTWWNYLTKGRHDKRIPYDPTYLSAAFSLDDPLIHQLDACRKADRQCAFILLNIEHYSQRLYPGHYEQLAIVEQRIYQEIEQILPNYFAPESILGLRHFHGQEYGIFAQFADAVSYQDLQHRIDQLRQQLEERLRLADDLVVDGALTFGAGFYVFEKDPIGTKLAISVAYYYAHMIAEKRLSAGFSQSRQELMDILNNESVHVLAQPIMDLHSGEIFGWEILSRGPKDTPYYRPLELFDFAHQADLLCALELMVVKKAFREIAERAIREQVFLNVTSVSLGQSKFYDDLVSYINANAHFNPQQIIFEITERYSIRDFREMANMMAKYRKLGFRFAIDDAGAGFASLQSISELIPDMIKIDRSIIQDIDRGKVKESMLKAVMQFADDIECLVIAEGIERQEEAEVLYRHSVTKVQGYYYAKPSPLHHDGSNLVQINEIREKIRLDARSKNKLA